MLHGVRIDCQLVDLPEQERVAVFGSEHFGVQVPALRARVVVTARRRVAGGHAQSATRTRAVFKNWHRRSPLTKNPTQNSKTGLLFRHKPKHSPRITRRLSRVAAQPAAG